MAEITVTTTVIQHEDSSKSVVLAIGTQDGGIAFSACLTPDGARNVAKLLQATADAAGNLIVIPSFDGKPPHPA